MEDERKIQVVTTYADRYLIRQLPGASYDKDAQAWRAPLSWASCLTLRGLFCQSLEIGPKLLDWAVSQRRGRIDPAMRVRDALTDDGIDDLTIIEAIDWLNSVESRSEIKLLPYQRADVAFMFVNRWGCILANPMGLGKTASAIRTLQVISLQYGENPFPALVICPNTVKMTWQDELRKFAPELKPAVISGPAGVRRKAIASSADVFMINWEALRIHSKLSAYGSMSLTEAEKTPKELNERGFKTVIVDEGHHGKDPHSKQTRAMWALMNDATYRFLMTGTPVVNNVGDVWSLLHAVDRNGFPAKTKFLERWARVELGFYGGSEILGLNPETADEFRAITNPLIRRIPKEAALPMLPRKLPVQYRYAEMSPAQAKLYRQMEDDMIVQVQETLLSAPNAISQLTRLLQFASASARLETHVVTDKVTGEQKEVQRVVLEPPSSKVDDLVELLDEMVDEPLVVAAVHTQLINLAAARLAKEGISCGLITGAQSGQERQDAISQFQDGKIRVMLLNIDAGGEGITLTRASTLLFMQRHWSKVRNDQVEDRIHRMGQDKVVHIIDQIAPDTVEYRKLESIMEKGERIEEIIQDRAALLRLLGAGRK